MEVRKAFKSIFGRLKNKITTMWKEINGYSARFSSFGTNIYKNEVARACIRTLAEHTSKANVKVLRGDAPGEKRLEKLIQYRPNLYMNGKDFLYKIRTLYELYNTVFIYIQRDDYGRCIGLYPIPECPSEAVDASGELYIKFYLPNGDTLVISWEDLAVLRKDYNGSDIWGDDNTAILTSLELLHITNEGVANAIKSTANLRAIVKSTKAMLSDEDVARIKDRFVSDYMDISNKSGVAALDATMDYKPIETKPIIANYKTIEELRNNIYRYYGMNEDIITSKAGAEVREAFYEARIEPFLLALSLELTNKVFTDRERGHQNEIMFESNRMSYMSIHEKLALVTMVDRMAMTPNEWRRALNLAPVPWGDQPQSWQNPTKSTLPLEDNQKEELDDADEE